MVKSALCCHLYVTETLHNSIIRPSQENASDNFKIIESANSVQWLSSHILKWAKTLKKNFLWNPYINKIQKIFYCSSTKR